MNEYMRAYFGKIRSKEIEDVLVLMHLAVDLNQEDWFYELAERYNKLFGGY
jgi:hypothetical protein